MAEHAAAVKRHEESIGISRVATMGDVRNVLGSLPDILSSVVSFSQPGTSPGARSTLFNALYNLSAFARQHGQPQDFKRIFEATWLCSEHRFINLVSTTCASMRGIDSDAEERNCWRAMVLIVDYASQPSFDQRRVDDMQILVTRLGPGLRLSSVRVLTSLLRKKHVIAQTNQLLDKFQPYAGASFSDPDVDSMVSAMATARSFSDAEQALFDRLRPASAPAEETLSRKVSALQNEVDRLRAQLDAALETVHVGRSDFQELKFHFEAAKVCELKLARELQDVKAELELAKAEVLELRRAAEAAKLDAVQQTVDLELGRSAMEL